MIQSVIARMAQNSFLIKGWSVTLAAALLGLSTKDDDTALAWVAFGAVAVFTSLDARYLALERKYVDLYRRATGEQPSGSEVSSFSLTAGKPGFGGVLCSLFSWSVILPHGTALGASLAVALLI
jgi:hypothetical protein